MSETKTPVVLAGKDYVVKQVPMARVKRLAATVAEVFADFDTKALTEQSAVEVFVDKLLRAPYAVLSLFIDDLPEPIFLDEDNGVTVPEMLDALNKAATLNRLDALKNGFSRLIPTLLQAQASISQTRS